MNNQYFTTNYAYPSFNSYKDYPYEKEGRFFNADEGLVKGSLEKSIYRPYKNYIVKCPKIFNEQDKLLLKIQQNGFAVQEAGLFLDINPENHEAIKTFSYYKMELEKSKNEYERKYGSLCLKSEQNEGYPYGWIKGPWPWEVR